MRSDTDSEEQEDTEDDSDDSTMGSSDDGEGQPLRRSQLQSNTRRNVSIGIASLIVVIVLIVVVLFATGVLGNRNTTSNTLASGITTTLLSISSTTLSSISASLQAIPTSSSPSSPAFKVSRTSPPSSFDGTAAGFASLCTVHYTDANTPYTDMIWNGTSGSVTREEIESALGLLYQMKPVTVNGEGNVFGNGRFGQAVYNAGELFELSGDRRALDLMLQLAENMHAMRNNPETGTIMWTGKREPLWPTTPLPPDNTTELPYAGCENGLFTAHMVTPVLYIFKNPCLWNLVRGSPPLSRFVPLKLTPHQLSGPFKSPNLDRTHPFLSYRHIQDSSRRITSRSRTLYKNFFLPWFFDSSTKQIIQPDTPLWSLVGDAKGNKAGEAMAWNRGFMIIESLLRLAAIHETSAAKDETLVAAYDSYIQANVAIFSESCEETTSTDGHPTYDWTYALGRGTSEEVSGIHSYYDIHGVFKAWQRNPTLFGLTDEVMQRFSNTMMYTIYQKDGTFSAIVDGTSTTQDPSVAQLWGGWTVYGKWLPEWYETVANTNYKVGFKGQSTLAIPLLWSKNAMETGEWSSGFASGS